MAGRLRCQAIFRGIKVAAIIAGAAILVGAARGGTATEQEEQSRSTRIASTEEQEMQKGIELTRRGMFAEAIPHFLTVRGRVTDPYALEFNLALCYVGVRKAADAIPILEKLRRGGHDTPPVENLLAQAFVSTQKKDEAWTALHRASALTPGNEKLYAFVADACSEQREFEFGLRVLALGLEHLPASARLHYQKGYFLARLDRLDEGRREFDLARDLAPQSELAVLAETQKNYYLGNLAETIRTARAASRDGRANDLVLAILGDALLREGATPGQAEFGEAETVLRKSIERRPDNASAQISLGYLLLIADRFDEALIHLEKGRELDPANPAAYRHLSALYRKRGDSQRADKMLAMLAKLNADEAARIYSAPGERTPVP